MKNLNRNKGNVLTGYILLCTLFGILFLTEFKEDKNVSELVIESLKERSNLRGEVSGLP